jgi:hypothetical protein
MDRMDRQHHEYRGWLLCVVPGRPCLGHGVRRQSPYDVIMARAYSPDLVLRDLQRQVDAHEDAPADPASSPAE